MDISQLHSAQHWRLVLDLVLGRTTGAQHWGSAKEGAADCVQRLAEKLGAGALPALTWLDLRHRHVGDAGASALAAALGRGALPRLKYLELSNTGIGDAGLVALAPALLALPALGRLDLNSNPLGDEGLAALLAPPPPAGASPPPTGGRLTKLKPLGRSRGLVDHRRRLCCPRRDTRQRRAASAQIPRY